MHPHSSFPRAGCVSVLVLVLSLHTASAGSATWNINPTNDWNTATNWTPQTVPNSPNDTATFSGSNVHTIVINSDVELNALFFTEFAYASTVTAGDASSANVVSFTLSGTGIVNNSQNPFYSIEAAPTLATNGVRNTIFLKNNATIAESTVVRANGGMSASSAGGQVQLLDNSTVGPGGATAGAGENGGDPGVIWFLDNSSASKEGGPSNGQLVAFGSGAGSTPGEIIFKGSSTASNAGVESFGATAAGVEGGKILFLESSDAENSVIGALSGGQQVPDAAGGTITFSDTASASSATLEAFGSSVSGGGSIRFSRDSTGGTAQVELTLASNATLVISDHNPPGITIGSLSDGFFGGGGIVSLGSNNLTVGSNNLTKEFSGVVEGIGSLIKIGTGILTLSGSSTYTGGTTVTAGGLRVTNRTGSATGNGLVNLVSGILAGSGTIAGPVSLGAGASLAPSVGMQSSHQGSRLSIQSPLSFLTDSTYSCQLYLGRRVTADQVVANGIGIVSGAHFQISAKGSQTLPVGTSFSMISNRSTNPIGGVFDDLPDGAIVTVNGNNLQANYKGGDGNDLVLTVVP